MNNTLPVDLNSKKIKQIQKESQQVAEQNVSKREQNKKEAEIWRGEGEQLRNYFLAGKQEKPFPRENSGRKVGGPNTRA
ncbi:hypothetical protein A3B87_00795 [Candidatus Kuenenbacteria bacterium RIFCSPHIGHO2_02_FULL_39_13]|uniref:Uncharacterized protein n=1 Tax=Candidatus Kuenenbacteria bacterium RIFCSPHIGHO2_02_FULL_39_13 TaxID=1798561 RepID=A0A1F6FNG1_9BACT|nr:MAG: hypothetical protein A3B87_00795 [Candidatus Kuenenbacteria bacterium RIFCSPHIGHO2_02_FULL_39_13]